MATAAYRKTHKEQIAAFQKKYRESHREAVRAANRRYRFAHPDRYTAQRIQQHERNSHLLDPKVRRKRCRVWMFWALKYGLIERPKSCSLCKKRRGLIQAHHPDYRYPLEVVWCCRSCHFERYHTQDERKPARKPAKIDWKLRFLQVCYLQRKGLNQCEISRELGIDNSTVCKYLNQSNEPRPCPSYDATRRRVFAQWKLEYLDKIK